MSTAPQTYAGFLGGSTSSSATLALSSGAALLAIDKYSLIIVCAITPPGNEITAVTANARATGTTWARLFRFDGGVNQGCEMWVGHSIPDSIDTGTVTVTTTWSVANTKRIVRVSFFRFAAAQAAPLVMLTSGAEGTGVTADPGALTPAVGDILLQQHWHELNASITSSVHTPGALEAYRNVGTGFISAPNQNSRLDMRQATTATPHKIVHTIDSSAWMDLAVVIRPTAVVGTETGHVYKGRNTAVLDTEGSL